MTRLLLFILLHLFYQQSSCNDNGRFPVTTIGNFLLSTDDPTDGDVTSGDGPSACLPEMVPTPCSDHDDYPDCFPAKDICDSESQCPQGEDELLCNQRNDCDFIDVPCRTDTRHCIATELVCNGEMDCPDGTDEFFCGSFQCPDGSKPSPCSDKFPGCIASSRLCNYAVDCPESADEAAIFCQRDAEYVFFGEALDDTVVSSDAEIGPIQLSSPVVFFGAKERNLYIASNGVLTFRSGLQVNTINNFVSAFNSCTNATSLCPIIAPFWQEEATDWVVYYQITVNHSQELIFLQKIRDIFPDFTPTLQVAVTWFNAQPNVTEEALMLFQTLLLSDGVTSFCILVYIEAAATLLVGDRVIGFSAGDGRRFITLLNRNEDDADFNPIADVNMFRIDGDCITSVLEGQVCGPEAVAVECVPDSLIATRCQCRNTGLRYNSGICEDIDECDTAPCPELAMCVNTFGGFECVCDGPGLTGDGTEICEDIDECAAGLPDCDGECVNTIGSFECVCEEGFELEEDMMSCADVDECESSPAPCGGTCINTEGSFVCGCSSLFVLSDDGVNCEASVTLIIVVSLSGVLLVLVVAIAGVFTCSWVLYQRRKKRQMSAANGDTETELTERRGSLHSYLRDLALRNSFARNVSQSLIISSNNLKLGETIGQGEFGLVYKGLMRRGSLERYSTSVAIKTLKGFLKEELVTDLLKECVKMQKFDHPNVLQLIGVCLDGGPAPYIIMAFMTNGSLLSYLKKERDQLVIADSHTDEDTTAVQYKLVDICVQVAKGMEYLASQRLIHRDLAARNCMIDVNFVIKVADFGLAENIDSSKDYFRQSNSTMVKLPIKWLAPECINDGVFSEKSDVWAYGVTCWEVFSGGKTPYPGIHPLELYGQLELGYRMERPYNAACSEEIYQVMMCCWNARAELRPTFSELVLKLSYLLGSATGYFDFITITNSQVFDTETPMPQRQISDNYVGICKSQGATSEHPRPQRLQSDSYLAMASSSGSASNDYISLNVSPTSSRGERILEEYAKNVPLASKATPPKPPLLASDSYVVMNTSLPQPSNITPTQLHIRHDNEGCDNAYVFTRI